MASVQAIPSPGIHSLNGVGGSGQNVDLISTDSSITITPNVVNRTVDITVGGAGFSAGTVIDNVPCDPSVYVGAAVRMLAGTAYNALADTLDNSNVIGFVESKYSATLCIVRVLGVSAPNYVGLDETQEYFLSDTVPGGITVTPVTTSTHILLKVGQPFDATRFLVLKGTSIRRG